MSVHRSAHDRRNAERWVREKLAKERKKKTLPPSGVRRPGARSAPASKLKGARPAHAVPASVDISTRAQAGGSMRCCQLCDARFVVSSGAVRHFEKRGWPQRTCCYDCTTAKKQAAAAAARAVAERLTQKRRPRPRGDDPVPPAVEGETQQTAGAPARERATAPGRRLKRPHERAMEVDLLRPKRPHGRATVVGVGGPISAEAASPGGGAEDDSPCPAEDVSASVDATPPVRACPAGPQCALGGDHRRPLLLRTGRTEGRGADHRVRTFNRVWIMSKVAVVLPSSSPRSAPRVTTSPGYSRAPLPVLTPIFVGRQEGVACCSRDMALPL